MTVSFRSWKLKTGARKKTAKRQRAACMPRANTWGEEGQESNLPKVVTPRISNGDGGGGDVGELW